MSMEKLSEEEEGKVSGSFKLADYFIKHKSIVDFSEEVEYECSWCHKKFKQMKGAVDFACPHCGYGGYKSDQGWQEWYEKHKDDKK